MAKESKVEVGIVYEGERIRGPEMHAELGGPKAKYKAELAHAVAEKDVEDGKVVVVGKDLKDLPAGESLDFGVLVEVYGKEIEKDLEPVIERRIHDFFNYVHGFMHLNQRYDIWCRISKELAEKGVSFKEVGEAIIGLYKAEMPFIEKMQVTFLTDAKEAEKFHAKAMKVYGERDQRLKDMKDEDVDEFYGCVLCQSFAPNHVCMISPQRMSLCGAISWLDGRAAAKVDPDGPIFAVKKGKVLDAEKGEYEGINEMVAERSNEANERFFLYSMFGKPHTSCGCFEAIAFYIPEVDGIGVVDRNFKGETVNGLKFSTMAGQSGGGEQTEGFLGFGLQWMRSEKFFSADGGWKRIVWMPSYIKEAFRDAIPGELADKIPTEKDVSDIKALEDYLSEKKHPAVAGVKKEEVAEAVEEKPAFVGDAQLQQPVLTAPTLSLPASGGVRIILKNARIHADKVIIKKVDKK